MRSVSLWFSVLLWLHGDDYSASLVLAYLYTGMMATVLSSVVSFCHCRCMALLLYMWLDAALDYYLHFRLYGG
jgi:hypothetical protein